MVSTQPKFEVEFKEEAVLAIQRQERKQIVLILHDDTAEIDNITYRTLGEVLKSDWTEKNYQYLTLAFLGNPSKVTVIKGGAEFITALEKLKLLSNYILAYPESTAENYTALINYLKQAREERNDYSFAVLGNATAPDASYIINFCTDDIIAEVNGEAVAFTAAEYAARVAGALGGLETSRSLTYFELAEIVSCTIPDDTDAPVAEGKLIIIHQDGSYKFGRAVNSLVTLTDGVTEAFQKIRVCTIMDEIANDIVSTFRTGYVGKYQNTYSNKCRFCNAINSYLNDLAGEGLLDPDNDNRVQISYTKTKSYIEGKGIDTSNMSYTDIIKYNTGSNVFIEGTCSPTDTMEDLDIVMYLFQALEAETV